MRLKVSGTKDGIPVTPRIIRPTDIYKHWGPWAMAVFAARRDTPLCIDGRCVWVEVVR